ncbi:Oxidoreductase UcpA [Fonsecaea pedrosoi]|nr:Oxidoreductase UcpA [Fonsecaea pedrosoi]
MSFPVRGKNAIVTGAGSGINLAFAKLLASNGAHVVVADIQETPAFKEFQKATTATKVLFHKTDVSSWKDLESLFAFAKAELGQIDVLCNGAGVFEPDWSSFWKDTEKTSYKSIDINVQGLMKGTRLAIRDQITRSKGRGRGGETVGVILNISSLAAQYALFNQPLYATSKAAVSAFTRSLAPLHQEFGIKVVAVAPGMVMTPLWSESPDKMKAISEDDVFATPEELAETMLLLVESAEYEGGTVLERLKNTTRRVLVDSPLPSGPGSTMSKMDLIYEDTIALLEAERKGGATK